MKKRCSDWLQYLKEEEVSVSKPPENQTTIANNQIDEAEIPEKEDEDD